MYAISKFGLLAGLMVVAMAWAAPLRAEVPAAAPEAVKAAGPDLATVAKDLAELRDQMSAIQIRTCVHVPPK